MLDLLLIGLLLYLLMRFFKSRRARSSASASYYGGAGVPVDRTQGSAPPSRRIEPSHRGQYSAASGSTTELETGLGQIRQFDPSFTEEGFKELAQDMFFRIQAAWMNRDLQGIEHMLTDEMRDSLRDEFSVMKQQGRINRLENIAVRKVELAEIWQESGKEYITVWFTANLLDYTVDDKTGQVVEGDRLNPVRFEEFWTFCRDIGSDSDWRLSAIQQNT